MRYKDYIWAEGPETVQIHCAQRLAELSRPQAGTVVQSMGTKTRVVTGKGIFAGESGAREFEKLSLLLAEGNSGMLMLTGMEPFPAFFSSLEMEGEPGPDCVRYSFSFVEAERPQQARRGGAYVCLGGESLWRVAADCGTTADALRALNPSVQWPNSLPTGEKLVLP